MTHRWHVPHRPDDTSPEAEEWVAKVADEQRGRDAWAAWVHRAQAEISTAKEAMTRSARARGIQSNRLERMAEKIPPAPPECASERVRILRELSEHHERLVEHAPLECADCSLVAAIDVLLRVVQSGRRRLIAAAVSAARHAAEGFDGDDYAHGYACAFAGRDGGPATAVALIEAADRLLGLERGAGGDE